MSYVWTLPGVPVFVVTDRMLRAPIDPRTDPRAVRCSRHRGSPTRRRRGFIARGRIVFVALFAFLLSSLAAAPAFADVTFALSWHEANREEARPKNEACVTEPALRDAVERKLGRNPFEEPERADIRIEGEERSAGNGVFRARVTQRDRRGGVLGTREIEAQTCSNLLRAATLVVALIVDARSHRGAEVAGENEDEPDGAPQVPGTAPEEGTPSAPPTAAPPSTPPRPRRSAGSRRRPPRTVARAAPPPFGLALGVGAGSTIGVLPSASVTLRAAVRLVLPRSRWSFDWTGAYSLPQTVRDGPVRGEFSAVEQQLRGCFAFARWPAFLVDACGGFAWGAVIPSTTGVTQGNDSWRVLAGPTAALAFDLAPGARRAPRAGITLGTVRLDVGVVLPLREYAFSYIVPGHAQTRLYSTDGVILFATLSGLGTIWQ